MRLFLAVILSTFLLASAFAAIAHKQADDQAKYDVKKGVEKVQYEWTRLNDKDKEILKESSELEKNSENKIKKELEEYRQKTDDLYKGLSEDTKKFISDKSKLHKKLSNKGKKLLDEMYFLTKRGITTFHIPGIDAVMPATTGKIVDEKNPPVPVVDGKPVSPKNAASVTNK